MGGSGSSGFGQPLDTVAVDEGPVPELQVHERPDAIAAFGAAGGVVAQQLIDRGRVDDAALTGTAVEQLIDAHAAGTTNGADAIWSLLNLELWYRTFVDRNGVQTLPDVRRPAQPASQEMRATA